MRIFKRVLLIIFTCILVIEGNVIFSNNLVNASSLKQKNIKKTENTKIKTGVNDENIIIESGILGNAKWTLYSNAELVFEGGKDKKFAKLTKMQDGIIGGDWLNHSTYIKTITFTNPVIANENSSYLLARLPNLTAINNLSYLNTSKVKNMSNMFSGDVSNISNLDLSSFNTSSVTDMSFMFRGIGNQSINLKSFNTSNVTTMKQMFAFSKLETLDLNSFNVAKVKNMNNMFSWCSNLKLLNLDKWNFKNLISIAGMFSYCKNLTTLNISKWNTAKVKEMESMFNGSAIKILNISKWNTSKVKDMSNMFNSSSVRKLNISKWNVSNIITTASMFTRSKIRWLDISKWNMKNISDASFMFYLVNSLQVLKLGKYSKFPIPKGSFTNTQSPNIKKTKKYTGAWVGKKTGKVYKTSATFLSKYSKKPVPDTYVWQKNNFRR